MEIALSDEFEFVQIDEIDGMNYWCTASEIFSYLDTIVPVKGSKFPCPVCTGTDWGCATIELVDDQGVATPVVAPCQHPFRIPNDRPAEMDGREILNYHYSLICLTCANTLFFNAAMVQEKLKLARGEGNGE
jgi:hypothetical protein